MLIKSQSSANNCAYLNFAEVLAPAPEEPKSTEEDICVRHEADRLNGMAGVPPATTVTWQSIRVSK